MEPDHRATAGSPWEPTAALHIVRPLNPLPLLLRRPCPRSAGGCGFQICLWCFNTLMESSPARCPNCRAEYVKEKISTGQIEPEG